MKPSRLGPLLIVAAFLVLASPFWLSGKVFIPGDFLLSMYPWKAIYHGPVHNLEIFDGAVLFYPQDVVINRGLKSGQLPLWNPTISAGYPMVASGESALFYPPRLLAQFLLSPAHARTLIILLHLLAMGLLMNWWLRSRGFDPVPAALGGMTWMLNSCIAGWLEDEHMIIIGAYLPLMLLAVDRGVERRQARWWCALALAGALSLSAGHLQLNLYSGLVVGLYAGWRVFTSTRWRYGLGWLSFSTVSTLLLATPILLPFLKLASVSQRLDQSYHLSRYLSPLWMFLATLVCPDVWGDPSRHFLLARTASTITFAEFGAYVGIIPLVLAVTAVCFRRKTRLGAREVLFWAAVCVVAMLFAAGIWPYPLLAGAIHMRLIPSRILVMFVFGAAVLASAGAQLLLDAEQGPARLAGRLGLGLALLWGVVYGPLAWWIWRSPRTLLVRLSAYITPRYVRLPPMFPGDHQYMATYVARLLYGIRLNYLYNPQMYVPLLAGVAIFWVCRRLLGGGSRKICWLLVIGTGLDLLVFACHFNTTIPTKMLYPPTPALSYLQHQPGLFRVIHGRAAYHNTLSPYGLQQLGGGDSFMPRRYVELFRRVHPNAQTILNSPFLDAMNVRYGLVPPMDRLRAKRWKLVFRSGVRVYRNTRALDRAYVVGSVRLFHSFPKLADFILSPAFEPDKEAAVESPPPWPLQPAADGSMVRIQSYTPNDVGLWVSMKAPGLLVLADSWYPGWTCTVDGHAVPIARVNGIVRGVYLRSGSFEVEFRFAPASVRIGFLLCLAVLIVMVVVIYFLDVRRSRGRP